MNLLSSQLDTPSYRKGVQMAFMDFLTVITIFITLQSDILDMFNTMRSYPAPQLNSRLDLDVPYAGSIPTVANRENINPLIIIAIIEIESGWDPYAVSYAGAEGLTQTMPFIQRAYDCGRVLGDPAESISCGGHFLGDLVHKYGTDNIEFVIDTI